MTLLWLSFIAAVSMGLWTGLGAGTFVLSLLSLGIVIVPNRIIPAAYHIVPVLATLSVGWGAYGIYNVHQGRPIVW